ncbi:MULTISPECIES: M48 family metallopeptidase [Francisella]|uniref:M48 family peptidase n=1 Tax=Francisella opportunistica TaxID=2016517 RepID=A0A345JRI2_9GAMM|nr:MULTISPECIES: SprT family zinc-dependent metalloprotease [Francisella]APC91658.1 putative metal-dependent hydrolase [Francisella sp. MA067296]AXH29928.1 M48 family peptidase [Francisella opportunistica]AXH31575.1 M48 family peptidase [Francisella opportunistica]AXH33223.1 M48 family peptidase [Francisella opportunistica]
MIDYNYSVVHKDVKDVTIKVKPSLEVEVVAPFETSDNHIQKLLQKRDNWIHKNLDIFRQAKQPERKLVSGEDFIYLGRRYRLKVILADINKAILKNGYLNLYCKDTQNFKLKSSILESFYKTKAEEHFKKAISKFRDFYNSDVVFRIRKMKTRWGSCNPAKSYINLNQELIKKPKKAIEYVVFHEIVHLKHHNHDRTFYNYISAYMPDWREIKKKLDFG